MLPLAPLATRCHCLDSWLDASISHYQGINIRHHKTFSLINMTIIFLLLGDDSVVNIALNKSAYQSSTLQHQYQTMASQAVDGNRDPLFSHDSCSHTNKEKEPFWIVDLGKIYRISHVIIINRLSSNCTFNSLWPNDAIWRQRSGSTLAQVMACCLTATSHYLNQC